LTAVCGTYAERPGLRFGTGEICTWDLATGKLVGAPRTQPGQIRAVAYSPNGKILATGGEDRVISRWDMSGGRELPSFPGHQGWVNGVAFLPDGHSIASASGDGRLRVWDCKNPKRVTIKELQALGSKAPPVTLAVTGDGEHLASGDEDGVIRLWNVATGIPLRSFEAHKGIVQAVAFSADDARLASGGQDGAIRLWDVRTGKPLQQLAGHPSSVFTLDFAPDGRRLASGGGDRMVRLWDLDTGKHRELAGHGEPVTRVAFTSNGKGLVSTSADDCRTILWEVATGEKRREFDVPRNHPGFKTMAVAPNGRLVAISRDDARMIKVWDLVTGELVGELRNHEGWIKSLAFSPDSTRLASGSEDTTILIWDLATLKKPSPGGADLTSEQLESCWTDLANFDAAKAYESITVLARVPEQSVAWVKKQLKPSAVANPSELAQLVKDLDSELFAVREKATKELSRLGDLAEPALRKLLAGSPTLEAKLRAQAVLEKSRISPERLQALRAVELLEYVGTPKARELLAALARGAVDSETTREAASALKRLNKPRPGS
jgi:WD40 repeat protein